MESEESKHRRLADAIEALLADGIRLTPEVMHYLDSAGGINTPEALEQAVSIPLDQEGETLFELVFFPDVAQQIRLEPIFVADHYNERDIGPLVDRLSRTPVTIPLYFPANTETCRIVIPQESLRQFIRRLNIDRTLYPRIEDAINAHTGDRCLALRLRVMLRNTRFSFSENTVTFICRFLAEMEPAASDYLDMFALTCDTIEETGPGADIHSTLMARRRRCAEAIRQTRNSELQLSGQPVEALIMKGINIVSMSVEEARRHMGWIDRIGLSIFGRIDPGECPETVNLGVFEKDGSDIKQVIKILK